MSHLRFVTGARQAALARGSEWAPRSTGPTLLMTGQDAVIAAVRYINPESKLVVESSLGPIELQSGTVYARKQILVTVDTLSVIYLEEDRLHKEWTSTFIRNHYLSVFPQVAAQAAWIVKLAKVEWAIISGLLAPMWAIAAVTVVDQVLSYIANPRPVQNVWRYGPCVRDELRWLYKQEPKVFSVLWRVALNELPKELIDAIEAEDVAFFVARVAYVLRNVRRTSFRAFLITLNTVVLALKTILRAGAIALGEVKKVSAFTVEAGKSRSAQENAEEYLLKELKKRDVVLSGEEARILVQAMRTSPHIIQRLERLSTCLGEFVPAIEELAEGIRPL